MGNLDIYYKCSGYCLERDWHKTMGMLEFYQFFITPIIHTDNSDIILFKTTEKQKLPNYYLSLKFIKKHYILQN